MPLYTIQGEAGKAVDATERDFEQLGWIGQQLSRPSLGIEELGIVIPLSDPTGTGHFIPDRGQEILLRKDAADYFRGHVTGLKLTPRRVEVIVSGPAWWLSKTDISNPQTDSGGTTRDRQQYVFGSGAASKYLGDHVDALFTRAVALGLPVALDSTWAAEKFFEFPQMTVSLQSFLDTLGEILAPVADVVGWWDHTVNPPEFHAERRADLTAHDFTHGAAPLVDWELNPRLGVEVDAVKLSYLQRNATTGATEFAEQTTGAGTIGKRQIITVAGPELTDVLPDEMFRSFEVETGNLGGVTSSLRWQAFLVRFDERFARIEEELGSFPTRNVPEVGFITSGEPDLNGWEGETNNAYFRIPESTARYKDGSLADLWAVLDNLLIAGLRPPAWLLDSGQVQEIRVEAYWSIPVAFFSAKRNNHEDLFTEHSENLARLISKTTGNLLGITNRQDPDPTEFFGGDPTVEIEYFFFKSLLTVYEASEAFETPTTLYETANWDFVDPPAGLADNLKSTQAVTPHDGYLQVREATPSATPWWARKYNVTGAISTLATAEALPKRIVEDLATAGLTIETGAPERFDYRTLVQRIRRNNQDNIIAI